MSSGNDAIDSIYSHESYRAYVQACLAQRIARNPSYSLTAFARALGMSQPFLSEILKGRKNLSPGKALRVATALELKESASEYFCLLVQLDSAREETVRSSIRRRMHALDPNRVSKDVSADCFSVIAEWYHFAIREMAALEGAKLDSRTVARRLGIAPIEAQNAIDRLLRLKLIEPDPQRLGRFRKTDDYVVSESPLPSEALRRFHRQMLAKAAESLGTQTPQEKLVGSETFAFSPSRLGEASQIMEEFFVRMARLSGGSEPRTHVYYLGVQFFNLTTGGSS